MRSGWGFNPIPNPPCAPGGKGISYPFVIATNADIPSKGYVISKTLIIAVNHTVPLAQQNITAPQNENASEAPQSAVNEKKEGFLSKLLDSINTFFANLFGKKK